MQRLKLPAVVVAMALTAAFVIFDVTGWARIPVVLGFALVVPGLGWAWRLRLADAGDTLLTAVTISVCLLVGVGEGMALLRLWSVEGGFFVLAVVAVAGVALPPYRSGPRSAERDEPPPVSTRAEVAGQ